MSSSTIQPGNQVTRNRSRGGLLPCSYSYEGGPIGSTTYQATVPNVTSSGGLATMQDVVTRNFRKKMKSGQWLNSPMIREVQTYRPCASSVNRVFYRVSDGVAISWENDTGYVLSGIIGNFQALFDVPTTINVSNLNNLATIDVWKGVEPAKSQTWVTMLEAHKSWETILNRVKTLSKVVEYCKKRDVKSLEALFPGMRRPRPQVSKKTLWDSEGRPLLTKRGNPTVKRTHGRPTQPKSSNETAEGLWLEYRYGWCPMVYDMVDTLKAVYEADLRGTLLPRDIYVSRSAKEETADFLDPFTLVSGGLTYTGNRKISWNYTVRCYIHYRVAAPDGLLRRLNDFGLFDVPKAVWEVAPWSFVVDWFFPITDWLGALTPKIGVEIVNKGYTARMLTTVEQTVTGFPIPVVGGTLYSPAVPLGSKDQGTLEKKVRSILLGELPLFPPHNVQLNIKRMVDAAALLKRMR